MRKARPGSVEFREQVQVTFTKRLSHDGTGLADGGTGQADGGTGQADGGTGQGAKLMVDGRWGGVGNDCWIRSTLT